MEDIAKEIRSLETLHKLQERYLDPEAKMDTPYAAWPKNWSMREWNPRLGVFEDPGYEDDEEGKP